MKEVYILLTKSTTYFSRLIELITSEDYTHASIGLEGIGGKFYSFGRKRYNYMLPAGFIIEEVTERKLYSGLTHYSLYKLKVKNNIYNAISEFIEEMVKHEDMYSYSILGVIACALGIPLKRRHHFFCSQFVANVLYNNGLADKIKDPNLTKPAELKSIEGIELVSSGYIGGMSRIEVRAAK